MHYTSSSYEPKKSFAVGLPVALGEQEDYTYKNDEQVTDKGLFQGLFSTNGVAASASSGDTTARAKHAQNLTKGGSKVLSPLQRLLFIFLCLYSLCPRRLWWIVVLFFSRSLCNVSQLSYTCSRPPRGADLGQCVLADGCR